MSSVISDLINQRFGKLLVVSQAGRDKWGQVIWNCSCDCGHTQIIVTGGNLRNRKEKNSCGCVKAERFRKAYTTHGHTRQLTTTGVKPSAEYASWQGMKKRCLNKSHIHYGNYGGRGVTICDRWLNSFENFLSDMGNRPVKTSLDRIDANGNYEPGNCRWADRQTQARNKR